jgi:hypothetical protein
MKKEPNDITIITQLKHKVRFLVTQNNIYKNLYV